MSDESPLLKSLTKNSTEVPVVAGGRDSYALLLVLLCVFAGGTVLLLTILLIFCHRCCPGGRRYSRASDDLEKTNTTLVEETQPSQDITIRLDGVDGLSAAGCHGDMEAEGFLSAVSTGRRVSFNEQAIYEQSKKSQEKGRRYTLTEGDFHHLKRARLTHLHIPPPALNILTIMESSETSIQQPIEEGLSWSPQSPSGGLPGDTLNSVLDTSFSESLPSLPAEPVGERGWTMGGPRADTDPEVTRSSSGATVTTGQGFTKMFLTKLRRHTSLEGASPYLRMKRWRLERNQRAASLDMRGSPKRRAFQRQRAASETLDQEEAESPAVGGDFVCSLAPPLLPDPASCPRRLSAGSLPSPTLGRLEVVAVMELSSGAEPELTYDLPMTLTVRSHAVGEENGLDAGHEDEELEDEEEEEEEDEEEEGGAVGASGGGAVGGGGAGGLRGWGGPGGLLRRRTEGAADGGGDAAEPTPYRDIWSLRASLEQYASSDLSSNDRDSTRSDADSLSSLGGVGKAGGGAAALGAGTGSGSAAAAMMFQSQDIDEELPYDEPSAVTELREEEEEEEEDEEEEEEERRRERRRRGGRGGGGGTGDSVDSDGEAGGRKLLQMDSGYASMDAPPLSGGGGGGGGKTASERRRYFTCAGRKGTVCESFEARLLQEEPDETELELESEENRGQTEPEKLSLAPAAPAAVIPKEPRTLPTVKSPLAQKPWQHRRRDYSIDERTEALFNEFLRHDPRLDPRPHHHHHHPRSARSSRLHLRAQWQRAKQHSDPGGSAAAATARLSPSLERLRWGPLRRGESAGYPLDASTPAATARYQLQHHHHHHHHLHGPLPRIASAADEENSEGAEEGAEEPKTASGSVDEQEMLELEEEQKQAEHCGTLEDPGLLAADKIAANLEERLYGGLRRTHCVQEQMVVVACTSPDDTAE
ncbi:voltage-dependent calcium channel beta subunit-associated regulatory protein [Sardina pilchardus]|uniref:voltage-dependent calcium channel beta subunit-associated regulatory protein n=1 Tax=Sardina pilchardus TaxID=27697 RepID=UPI002E11BADD